MGRLAKAIGATIGATMGAALSVAMAGTAQAAPPFRHILLVIQENRTVDNLFGSDPTFEPGVDIATSGIDSHGATIVLGPEPLNGCYDPGHGHPNFENELTQGADVDTIKLNAGCVPPKNPIFRFASNGSGMIKPYFAIAKSFGFANRMFQTNQGPSFPAHQFLFGGTSAPSADTPLFVSDNMTRQHDGVGCLANANQTVPLVDGSGVQGAVPPIYPCLEHDTLGDVLSAAGVSWRYYANSADDIWVAPNAINHLCEAAQTGQGLACTAAPWTDGTIVANNSTQILTDIQNCNLASVSWVTPTSEASDHAGTTDGTGPQWVASIVNAIGEQPACANGDDYWNDTAILITWDDWGGWYDHVAPFAVNVTPPSPAAWGDGYTYGFRVPLLVVSPYTERGTVDNTVHDFGSLLYFVERNFGVGFIGPGGDTYGNYADYQAAERGDTLSAFFTLKQPRPFQPIKTSMSPADFIRLPPDHGVVDDE